MTAYDARPSTPPPGGDGDGQWKLCRDGRWRAFYKDIGPGGSYPYEHPWDPNWWAPTERRNCMTWACRHGWMQGGHCRAYDGENCGDHPREPNVTDEEIETAVEGLTALLSSMESK